MVDQDTATPPAPADPVEEQEGLREFTEADLPSVDAIVERVGGERHHVIPILHEIQEEFRYLPPMAMKRVTEVSDITPAQIVGVATFYNSFRHKPIGKHLVKVCVGTACHVANANAIHESFLQELCLGEGEDTSQDGLFTVEKVACVGCCSLAPVVQMDDDSYGPLTTDSCGTVLRDVLANSGSRQEIVADGGKDVPEDAAEIRISLDSSDVAQGADKVFLAVQQAARYAAEPIRIKTVSCVGLSSKSPLVEIVRSRDDITVYSTVKPEDARDIVYRHFPPANPLRRAAHAVSKGIDKVLTDEAWYSVRQSIMPKDVGETAQYFGRQVRVATEHAGEIDPLDFDEYCRRGGFEAMKKVYREMEPDDAIKVISDSGLRGRGGAGFPTGTKWGFVKAAQGEEKYVICNGDEGDPGAFMDRMILESYPYRVIEGMAIAAKCAGAHKGIFYIRAEYPQSVKRIEQALEICRNEGIVGENVLGTGFDLDIQVFRGAGAFICGEETALIASIEGERGMPRTKPPFPATHGLWGRPTLINNVETLSMISWIIRNGAGEFSKWGTETSKGTKVFALAGKVRRGGLIEVPLGITIREIVDEIGGGVPSGRALKAVQMGGPSGGMIPESLCDTPIDYESLKNLGAIMGSGGMVVLDDTDCMVDVARYFLEFAQDELCGQCSIGRIGTTRLWNILERVCEGKGKAKDLKDIEDLSPVVQRGSLCGLCKTAPNPAVTTLKYFREEYEEHLNGHCRAGVCSNLIHYTIEDNCIGCTLCAQYCPVDAIPLTPYRKHEVIDDICIRCNSCYEVCPEAAVFIK